jgi:transposase
MRTYDKEFKIDAVNLFKSSGRSMKQIAQELGLATSSLSKWIKEYSQNGDKCFPGKGHANIYEEEVKALRKELLHTRQERDILKKALAIFSTPQGKGMNS